MFNLNPKKIDWNKELGTGAFASIYPYQNDQTDQKWVIKKQTAKTFKELLRFFQEIVLGFSFDHFAILPVRGYFIEESSPQIYNIYMKLPRMKKTLKSLIDEHRADNNTPISEETHVKILYNLSCALEYLQNKRIAHRDIKPANILIGGKGEIKLADIGIARFEAEDETLKTIRESTGTLYYMAPELDEGPKKNRDLYKGDIWSLGILMIETCLLRTKIMPQTLPIEQKKEILDVCLTKIEETYGKEFAGVIASLVHLDPNQRKTASEVRKILESKYLKVLNLKQKDGSEPVYIEENKEAYTPLSHGNIKRHKNSGSNADSFGELMEIEEEKHKSRHLDEPQSSVEQLKEMVKDLQDKWNQWFTSSLGELLTVKANANATDENAFYYIKDFQGKMKEQDTINLPKVLLDFENCKCITDDTFEQINTLVEEDFGSTESLSLNFASCENLTEESMKPLIKSIKNISALKEVYINLKGCSQISENFKKWAQDELALIQKSSVE